MDARQDDLRKDPLVGIQQRTDSAREAATTPREEVTLRDPPRGEAVKSRAVAGWLGILLGLLGAHRFYLGYTRIGALQLGLTVLIIAVIMAVGLGMGLNAGHTFLNAISAASLVHAWGLIEGVMILIGALNRDGENRPLR